MRARSARSFRRIAFLGTFASALSGCAVLAGAGVGYVVSQQVLPNDVHTAQVARDVERVWESARETAEILHDPASDVLVEDFPRTIRCNVDRAKVEIQVEAHDVDRTLIRVQAEKYLASDNTTAAEVMRELLDRLE